MRELAELADDLPAISSMALTWGNACMGDELAELAELADDL
jgi:hypothetical protein